MAAAALFVVGPECVNVVTCFRSGRIGVVLMLESYVGGTHDFLFESCWFLRKEVEGLIAVEMLSPVRGAAWAIVVTSSFSKGKS